MDKNLIEKAFYVPVCNQTEIERIFNVNNVNDYLLKLRADTIVDNMRLFRVYRNKALLNQKNWSLEQSFSEEHYRKFLKKARKDVREKCKGVLAGNIFSTEPYGKIFSTEYGPITTICDSLQFFFKFMNLGIMDFGERVPPYVQINSIRIALRVMLKTEALDFFMDPRGIVPSDIGEAIHEIIPYQLQFIAGHEYAHHFLGHLDNEKLTEKPILRAIFRSQSEYGLEKVYSYRQREEFEADENSILLCNYSVEEKIKIFESALIWFGYLDIFEGISETISPSVMPSTHPSARDRFENLLDKIDMPQGYDYEQWSVFIKNIDVLKDLFIRDISLNTDGYEAYVSAYLDKPNTEWRGKELIDRVDYY